MNSGKIVAGRDGTSGRTDGEIEGSTRGPRGPKKWRSGQVTPMPHSKTDRLRKIELLSSLEVGVELS